VNKIKETKIANGGSLFNDNSFFEKGIINIKSRIYGDLLKKFIIFFIAVI